MLNVIIADDEQKICTLLRMLVDWESLGFKIIAIVNNGRMLKEKALEFKPDLVITDIQMPECSGLEFLHYIREHGLNMEVLIISGYRDFDYVRKALRNGAVDYLLKPLSKEALEMALKKVLEKYHVVLQTQKKIEKMSDSLSKMSKIAGRNLIYDILDNRLTQISKTRANEEYNCGFDKRYLYSMVIKVDMKDAVLMNLKSSGLGSKIEGVIENAILVSGNHLVCGIKDNLFYVLTDADNNEAVEKIAYHIIYDIRELLANINNGHVSVGLAVVDGDRAKEAVDNGFVAVWDSILKGPERVYFYRRNDNETQKENLKVFPDFSKAFLSRSLELYNAEVSTLFGKLIQEAADMKSGYEVYKHIQCIQANIEKSCKQVLNSDEDEDVLKTLERYRETLSSCYRINIFEKRLLEEGNEVIGMINERLSERERQPVRRIKELIRKRYNENLSLQDISEELNMASSYISRLCKKELNVNFTQYLNTVRIEKAKELLEATNKTVAEIAELTGYNDEKYFMRIFKKEVGITTKEYRRLYGA